MANNNLDAISIRNLEVNFPEEFSTKGSLQKLHNMRYIGGGVENVYEFKQSETIKDFNNFSILHIHNGNYIVCDSTTIRHASLVLSKLTSVDTLISSIDPTEMTVSHFGNVLFVTNASKQWQFLLKDDSYTELEFDAILPPEDISIEYKYTYSDMLNTNAEAPIVGYNSSSDINYEYSMAITDLHDKDYIFGAYYLIFAYRLYDGSIIKNSRAFMVATEDSSDDDLKVVKQIENGLMIDGNSYDYTYYQKLSASKPTITINIDQDAVATGLIDSIVIFATRPENIYDFKNYHTIFENYKDEMQSSQSTISVKYFHDSDISKYITRPIYEIEEIELSEAVNNQITTTLSYKNHFSDIEYNSIYSGSFSAHTTRHANMFEYNGRLHTFNQTLSFHPGHLPIKNGSSYKVGEITYNKVSLPTACSINFFIEISTDDSTIEVLTTTEDYIYCDGSTVNDGVNFGLPIDNFISYQDYRAEKINIYYEKYNERMLIASFSLTSSVANNMAYYNHATSDLVACISIVPVDSPLLFSPTHAANSDVNEVEYKNKIMVSLLNNPFVFDAVNTYQIEGSECEIYDLCTAADQITENSYGNHPLIVFTSSGIFALQQGSGDVLYSRTVLLDSNALEGNVKSIPIGGIIIFTANEQVMALSSRSSASISKTLDISADRDECDISNFATYLEGGDLYSISW
ncbi:MAG: hypothetical protein R3Y04_03735, partial [Rikenellaceae bacterium]